MNDMVKENEFKPIKCEYEYDMGYCNVFCGDGSLRVSHFIQIDKKGNIIYEKKYFVTDFSAN